MERSVAAEQLDGLAANDPAALGSRRDLQRIHRVLRTKSLLLSALDDRLPASPSTALHILELGAGDGSLLLQVAGAMRAQRRPVEITLLDRLPLIDDATIIAFRDAGWIATARTCEVAAWCADPAAAAKPAQRTRWDIIIANLFLHHFETAPLAALLSAVALRCDHFIAFEPRRSGFALAASHLIGVLGANAVTREDAVLSVHAGFNDHELSALWPERSAQWQLQEHPAGPFSHCFTADRTKADHAH